MEPPLRSAFVGCLPAMLGEKIPINGGEGRFLRCLRAGCRSERARKRFCPVEGPKFSNFSRALRRFRCLADRQARSRRGPQSPQLSEARRFLGSDRASTTRLRILTQRIAVGSIERRQRPCAPNRRVPRPLARNGQIADTLPGSTPIWWGVAKGLCFAASWRQAYGA